MSATSKFLENIKDHRSQAQVEKFEGRLEDYLQLLEENKDLAVLSHKPSLQSDCFSWHGNARRIK